MMRETVEAVVIGSGAGGGCAAKVLACAGIKTLVLERGEWAKGDVLGENDLASQRSPCLCLGPGPGGVRVHIDAILSKLGEDVGYVGFIK